MLYHCTGGRDRTRHGLCPPPLCAGFPEATIEADFTASNVYLQPMHARMYWGMSQGMGLDMATIKKEMDLRPELLHIFFGAIKNKYGSIEKFMEQELGIGKKELALLKKKYTI